MFRRSSWGLLLPKLALLTMGVIVLAACGSGTPKPTAARATGAPGSFGDPAAAAPLAIASVPAADSAKKAVSTPSASGSSKGRGKAASVNSSGNPASGGNAAAASNSGGLVTGIAVDALLSWSPTEQAQQLAAMKATGVTSIRVDASWYNTQAAGAGSYNWAPLDTAVSSIQQAGLTADLIIDQCPPWAAASGAQGPFAQPASPTAFGNFAAAVAQRYYGKGAKYFEIWNEPNNPAFWSPAPNPAAYTADLQAAYTAIKAVTPSAVVLTGGLAPQADSSNSYDIVTFFQDMYADGAAGYFDGVGDHPYTYPYAPDSVTLGSAWTEMAQTSTSLRSLMAAHGDSGKKIWITEFGAPTGSGGVSEAQQSDEIAQALAFAKQTSWIASFYVYSWQDGASDTFGLLNEDGTQKSAYGALVTGLH